MTWMKPKNFAVKYPYRQTSMKDLYESLIVDNAIFATAPASNEAALIKSGKLVKSCQKIIFSPYLSRFSLTPRHTLDYCNLKIIFNDTIMPELLN